MLLLLLLLLLRVAICLLLVQCCSGIVDHSHHHHHGMALRGAPSQTAPATLEQLNGSSSKTPYPRAALYGAGPGARNLSYGGDILYWRPNGAGLFSLFLQLRLVHNFASHFNKSLVAGNTSSPHYESHTINLCKWFYIPMVQCGHAPRPQKCAIGYLPRTVSHEFVPTCVEIDAVIKPSGQANLTRRHEMVGAVNDSTIPFVLQPSLVELGRRYMATLGVNRGENITVVHWRRGDQLVSRCRKEMDVSVNCKDAPELAAQVRRYSNDSMVFIATNEPQMSPSMEQLRNEYHFKTFVSVPHFDDLTPMQVLAIETLLMLEATTFLGWGVSEVNDVVEHERMMHGKSYCVGHDERETGWAIDVTWCKPGR